MDVNFETPEGIWCFPEELALNMERRFRCIGELKKVMYFPPWLMVRELERMYRIPDNRTDERSETAFG